MPLLTPSTPSGWQTYRFPAKNEEITLDMTCDGDMEFEMKYLTVLAFVAAMSAIPAVAQEISDTTSKIVDCREIEATEARLACYDKATVALEKQVEAVKAAEAALAADPERALPQWARIDPSADKKQVKREKKKKKEDKRDEEMEVTVVKVFQNNAGRYFIRLDNGQLWSQVVIERIDQPDNLPAKGRIWKSFYGSPWFEFEDKSYQDFKIKRVK